MPETVRGRWISGEEVDLGRCETIQDVKVVLAIRQKRFAPEVVVLTPSGVVFDDLEEAPPALVLVVLKTVNFDVFVWQEAIIAHADRGDFYCVTRIARLLFNQGLLQGRTRLLEHVFNEAAEQGMDFFMHYCLEISYFGHWPDEPHIMRSKDVNFALWFGARGGHVSICELALENNADINFVAGDGDTPLMLSARGGHRDICQVLLRRGADLTMTNFFMHTARELAEREQHEDVVLLLCDLENESKSDSESGINFIIFKERGRENHQRRVVVFSLEQGREGGCHLLPKQFFGGKKTFYVLASSLVLREKNGSLIWKDLEFNNI